MQLDESRDGGVLVLDLAGRLDAGSSPPVEAKLLASVRGAPAVLLDLAGLDYVSSAGLRVLLKAAKEARAAGSRFALAGLRPAVREVFEVSGFFAVLTAYPTRAEALAALR